MRQVVRIAWTNGCASLRSNETMPVNKLMGWLRHAFAVESAAAAAPSDDERELVDRLCREIVRRRLTTPAQVFLETFRPMNYLSAQTIHFFAPILSALGDAKKIDQFAEFLGRRGSVDYLCQRIEELERESNHE